MAEKKKKLLFITTSYPRFRGDTAGCFFVPLIERLKKEFSLTIIAPDSNLKSSKSDDIIRVKYFWPGSLQNLAYNQGIPENISKNPLLILQFPFLFLAMLLQGLWQAKNHDVIITNWLLPCGLVGAIISSITKNPHIAVEHSAGIHYLSAIPLGKNVFKFTLKNIDKLIFVSQYLYEKSKQLVSTEAERVEIIPMGVETKEYDIDNNVDKIKTRYQIPENNLIVLFIGRMVNIKGLDTLIKSLSGIENVTLIAAGEGSERQYYQNLSNDLKVHAIFTGFLKGIEKIELFKASDIVVFPSRILKNGRSEGTPVSIIEAMAAQKVIFASNTGGIPFIIEDNINGKLFNPDNVKELNNLFRDFLANKDFYYKISKEAKKSVAYYDIENISAKYKSVIDEVSKHGRS